MRGLGKVDTTFVHPVRMMPQTAMCRTVRATSIEPKRTERCVWQIG
jgi:hypothetical protein